MTPGRHLAIVGPTATGKSAVAMALARAGHVDHVVSVDSMQVYRGMDIGTAKPTPAERAEVPHHCLDLAEPGEDFTLVRYQDAFGAAMAGIDAAGQRATLVGGTGLYLRAVLDGLAPPPQYPALRAELEALAAAGPAAVADLHRRLGGLDPAAAAKMEPTNARRVVRALEVCLGSGRRFSSSGPGLDAYPPAPVVQVGLRWGRAALAERIAARYQAQLAAGFLDEARALAARPGGPSRTAAQALGYRELLAHLAGDIPRLDDAVALAVTRTRQFAARQERWFRRDPRIVWLDVRDANPLSVLPSVLEAWGR